MPRTGVGRDWRVGLRRGAVERRRIRAGPEAGAPRKRQTRSLLEKRALLGSAFIRVHLRLPVLALPMKPIEVLYTPADFEALARRDLSATTCVVFDVLRATSSMVTALAAGADSIRPLATIAEALAARAADPAVLLAGERDGLRIGAALTGGVEFDFGNSPREFTPARVAGRRLVMTTTNGTRALRACAGAAEVFVSGFLNLAATAAALQARPPAELVLVGSGTFEEAAWEDTLGAGALLDLLVPDGDAGRFTDGALLAWHAYRAHRDDLAAALGLGRNGRRLLARPELAADVAACAARDAVSRAARMGGDGLVRLSG